jgi:hypothetical protein
MLLPIVYLEISPGLLWPLLSNWNPRFYFVHVPLEPHPTQPRGRPWIELNTPLPPMTADIMYKEQARYSWYQEVAARAENGFPGFAWSAEGLLVKEADN